MDPRMWQELRPHAKRELDLLSAEKHLADLRAAYK
jgi:hypothetical protein